MNIEKHLERLQESLQVLDESITKGVTQRQRTIGFNVSAASSDMFEIFLHQENLVDPGFVVKHEWFTSKHKKSEKFPFDFENKELIFRLMTSLEEARDPLCYGTPKTEQHIQKVIVQFNQLKKLFKEKGVSIE